MSKLHAGRVLGAVLLSTAIPAISPTTAAASTVFVGPSDAFPGDIAVRYVADAGEANRVTVTDVSIDLVDIRDPGATITVGSGCTSLSPHRARCSYPDGTLEVDLGDGDDFLSLSRTFEAFLTRLRGGDGDDTIVAGRTDFSSERLLGGRGNDTLRGREGRDLLNGGPGADRLSGGTSASCGTAGTCIPDGDTVTYAGRTNDVFADTDGVADDGEKLEGDLIRRDIERIVGGDGDDKLVGTTVAKGSLELKTFLVGTTLFGRGGNDVLRGGRRANLLIGGRGDDLLRGMRAQDRLIGRRGNDRLFGGRGRDLVRGSGGHDVLLARDRRADRINGGHGRDRARIDSGLDRVRRVERILP